MLQQQMEDKLYICTILWYETYDWSLKMVTKENKMNIRWAYDK